MKNRLLVAALFLWSFSYAQKEIHFSPTTTESSILSKSETEWVIKSTISSLRLVEKQTVKGIFNQLKVGNYTSTSKIGTPELPQYHQLIEIPVGATYDISIVSSSSEVVSLADFGNLPIYPRQQSLGKSHDPKKVPFHYSENDYLENEFSDDPLASLEKIGTMRSRTIGRLDVSPFSYNPSSNTLKVCTEVVIKITFLNIDKSLQKENKKRYGSPLFEANFSKLVANEKQSAAEKDLIVSYPTTFVIVSDPQFQSALQPFIQWKTKKGFKVIEAYTNNPQVGQTTTSIRNYLMNLYNSATISNPAPSYLLLVGDVDQIPSFSGTTGPHVTDLYYCEYDGGDDFFPELYYGRFSANNVTELQAQIDKTLEYEQYLFPDDSFLDDVILISGVDADMAPTYGNGQINYGTDYYFNSSNGFNANVWLYPASDDAVESDIFDKLNAGCSFVNYTAHGYEEGWADPSFDASDVSSLTNAHKYPTMIGNCCLSNSFNQPSCFGERLMRAANKGAIGYIGGSAETLWDEDYYWGTGFKQVEVNPSYDANNLGAYDCEFHSNGELESNWFVTQSQMIFAGNMAVTTSGSDYISYYWEIYHLMGDPSLMTYMRQAPEMVVTHNQSDLAGLTSLNVNAEPYAYVAVSANGVLLDAKYTAANSTAILQFSAVTQNGPLDIVVTKQNRQPYFGIDQIGGASLDEAAIGSFQVFPNPVQETLSIRLDQTATNNATTIVLRDVQGRLMYSEQVGDKKVITVDTSSFAKGMYTVEVVSAKGILLEKIIK